MTALKPSSLTFAEAAAVPLAALTALQALRKANFKPGDKVFVGAGAGGVGHFAVQIAKALGASSVTSTASGSKMDVVRGLGADVVLDYRNQPLSSLPHDFDVALDMVNEVAQLIPLVKPGGSIVSVSQAMTTQTFADAGITVGYIVSIFMWFTSRSLYAQAAKANVRLSSLFMRATREDLETLSTMFDAGQLKVLVQDNVFNGIGQAPQALAKLEAGRVLGKVTVVL